MSESKCYHLADGVIASVGPMANFLLNIVNDHEVKIDYRYLEPLERLSMGWQMDGYESFIPLLLKQGVIIEGEVSGPDPVLQDLLRGIDDVYMHAYRDALSPRALEAYELVLEGHARRKRFYERVGQCPILPETALRRALLVGDADEVGVKDVLCLGDDDLVSLALRALGHRVTVYDIDTYLMNFLQALSDEKGLDLNIVARDLRDPLEEGEAERFDVFLTDPMSNRDCIEIFLSRAFAMLRPGGQGFSAVYAPVSRLFAEISKEMHFDISRWHRGHNRYYSKYFKLHHYESDWVELRKTSELVLPHAPDAFSVPLNLYREDYYQRPKGVVVHLDEIIAEKYAQPFYLDMLLDALEERLGRSFETREKHLAKDWSFFHCRFVADQVHSYLNIYSHRGRRQLSVDLYPNQDAVETTLREMLMAVFKDADCDYVVISSRKGLEVRIK